MRLSTVFLSLTPMLAIAQPQKLVARQDPGPIDVPEGPLPLCTSQCFGRWGWPITLCTGQEGLNHLIECFYEECEDEPRRIHAQLAAEQNCEEGMGWPTRMPEDLEVESLPAEEEESTPSTSASSSAGSGQASPRPATSSSSSPSVPTGAFDVENPSSTISDAVASATETPNGAGQTAFGGYAGVAAAVIGVYAVL